MFIQLQYLTQTDQQLTVSTDSDNPDGIVLTITELDEPKKECRLYLSESEIEMVYKMLKDANSYRAVK